MAVAAALVAAAATVENRVSGAARVVFTVEMQIPTTRVQTCIARMCALCARRRGALSHRRRCTLRQLRIPNRALRQAHTDGGGVLFLTSLSSPEGLYGYSLPSVSHMRVRFSPRSFSAACAGVHIVVVVVVAATDFLVSMLTHSAGRADE